MNTHRKSSTMPAAVMAMILAVPGSAWAGEGGDDDHDHGWNKGGCKRNEHYNNHYNNSYYGHYAGRGSYYPHYYPSYPCSTCGKNNHHNNNNNNDKLWIGLLGGGILGYGLNAYQHRNTADQSYYPQANSAPPPPPQYASTSSVNPCLQEREYRTKIMVGGKQVEGYGTACLQPDGSWRYGAAQPESY